MSFSLILNPDSLPKLSNSTTSASTNPQIGRQFLNSNTDVTPVVSPLGVPIFAPTLQASLKQILNGPSSSLSQHAPGSSTSQGHDEASKVPALPLMPETLRQRSPTGSEELAREPSKEGNKLITSDFSPSQSPQTFVSAPRSATVTSTNILPQLESTGPPSLTISQDAPQFPKRLLPAFLEDERGEPPEKRARLGDSLSNSNETDSQDFVDPEAMVVDNAETQDSGKVDGIIPVARIGSFLDRSSEDVSSLIEDKPLILDLLSPVPKGKDYEPQLDIVNDMTLSDNGNAQGFSSDSELFDEYDPYFDTFEV